MSTIPYVAEDPARRRLKKQANTAAKKEQLCTGAATREMEHILSSLATSLLREGFSFNAVATSLYTTALGMLDFF